MVPASCWQSPRLPRAWPRPGPRLPNPRLASQGSAGAGTHSPSLWPPVLSGRHPVPMHTAWPGKTQAAQQAPHWPARPTHPSGQHIWPPGSGQRSYDVPSLCGAGGYPELCLYFLVPDTQASPLGGATVTTTAGPDCYWPSRLSAQLGAATPGDSQLQACCLPSGWAQLGITRESLG